MSINENPEWEWLDRIQVGDVLKLGKSFRVVRSISKLKSGRLHCVAFAIKRCSWTGACYTVMNKTDLKQRGVQRVGVRVKLITELDKQIAANIALHNNRLATLHCCDVKGVA